MDIFLVRRSLPGIPEQALRDAVQRCRTEADELARAGHLISYLGCTYVAADGFCGCLYEATSADVVRLATERAAVPYDDIVRAVLLGAPDAASGGSQLAVVLPPHQPGFRDGDDATAEPGTSEAVGPAR